MYTLTQADLDATTQKEWAFGTTRCLPAEKEIPKEFWGWPSTNIYVLYADALWISDPIPPAEETINPGFTGNNLLRFLEAHLREPLDHEHKIAAIAFMISKIVTLKPKV